jgi:TolB-like protein/Flp pilus assembly protein TadD
MADRAEPEDLQERAANATASTEASRVFVSYASPDATVAGALVESLERHGIACWIAPRDVKAGALYADAIVRAISGAKALVLVLSESAIGSSHVGKEVERASSKKRPIIALRIDNAPLTPALEYFLSESQWIEAQAENKESAYGRLIDAIREPERAAPRINSAATPPAGAAPAGHPKGLRKRILLAAVLTVVAVAVAALLVDKFWQAKNVAAEQPTTAARGVVSDKSIAVLPFTDMSEKKDQEYFADGIAEEVLDRLAKVPGLKVVGRASSFQFKGKSADPASIGTALGVAYLLEGSVRKEVGRVRVAAQLVETRSGAQRWSDRFDSDVVDMLQVQDTIAVEIARALQIAVEVDTAPRSSIKSPEALDAYLRGLQSVDRQSRESSEAAVASFQQALALDPTFAPAAIGLAKAYTFIGNEGWLPTKVAFERARKAALLAQQLDPQSPSPHVRLAEIYVTYDWDWAGADRELHQALALGPRNSDGARIASQRAAAIGQWDEARQLGIEAVALDPLDPYVHMILGWGIYLHTGDFAEAEQSFRRGLQIALKWGSGQYFLGEALMLQGHYEPALAEFRKETPDDGQFEGSAMAHFAAGRKSESDAALAEAIRHNGTSWPSEIARVYAFRGEKDRAFEWLDRAFDLRDEDLYVIKGDPLLKNLEGDPRYKAFLRKMNLPVRDDVAD